MYGPASTCANEQSLGLQLCIGFAALEGLSELERAQEGRVTCSLKDAQSARSLSSALTSTPLKDTPKSWSSLTVCARTPEPRQQRGHPSSCSWPQHGQHSQHVWSHWMERSGMHACFTERALSLMVETSCARLQEEWHIFPASPTSWLTARKRGTSTGAMLSG